MQTQPCCIDKSTSSSANWWWSDANGASVPPPGWKNDVAEPNRRIRGDFASTGNRCEAEQDKCKQNGSSSNIEVESEGGRDDCGRMGGSMNMSKQFSGCIHNHDVTASSYKHAEIVRDRGSEDPKSQSRTTSTTQTSPTQSKSRPRDDAVLQQTGLSVDDTNRSTVTAASHPLCNDEKSQNLRGITARTDQAVGRATESVTTGNRFAAVSTANDEQLPRNHTQSLSTEPDPARTGSTSLTGRKGIPAEMENIVDQASPMNVNPSITTVTKMPNKTYVTQDMYATNRANTEITVRPTETPPNVGFSSVTGTDSALAENVRPDRKFGSSTAKHESVPEKDGTVSAGNLTTNSERATYRKSPSNLHSLTSSSTVKPGITSIIETLSSSSQGGEKTSANTASSPQGIYKDEANSAKADRAATGSTTRDRRTVVTGVKHIDVSATAVRRNQNNVQPYKAANSSTTEQATAISETSQSPGSLKRNSPIGLNDAATPAGETGDTASVNTDTGPPTAVVDPVAVKLVRVDRMLRSVPPVAPENIRRTGIATPAVQAQNVADTTVTTPRAAPRRSMPTTDTRPTDKNVEQFGSTKNTQTTTSFDFRHTSHRSASTDRS